MSKTLLAIAAAILAATTLFASAAEAGSKVRLRFGGPLPYFTAYSNSGGYQKPRRKRRHHRARRKAKTSVHATRNPRSETSSDVAKTKEKPKLPVAKAAESENSSITTAALPKSEEEAGDKPATAQAEATATATVDETNPVAKVDCKKFFPSVGMTLTVPCD